MYELFLLPLENGKFYYKDTKLCELEILDFVTGISYTGSSPFIFILFFQKY